MRNKPILGKFVCYFVLLNVIFGTLLVKIGVGNDDLPDFNIVEKEKEILKEIDTSQEQDWTGLFVQQYPGDDEYYSLAISPTKGAVYHHFLNSKALDWGFAETHFENGEVSFKWIATSPLELARAQKLYVTRIENNSFLIPRHDIHSFVLNKDDLTSGRNRGWMKKTLVMSTTARVDSPLFDEYKFLPRKTIRVRKVDALTTQKSDGMWLGKQYAIAMDEDTRGMVEGTRFSCLRRAGLVIKIVEIDPNKSIKLEIKQLVERRSKAQRIEMGDELQTSTGYAAVAILKPY